MKSKLLSLFAIVLLLCAIATLGSGAIRQSQLNESSQQQAILVTQTVLSGNPRYQEQPDLEDAEEIDDPPTTAETFAGFAHQSLLERRSIADLDKYFYTLTLNLGPLQSVESIAGNSDAPLLVFDPRVPSAEYSLQVEFSRGSAQVDIDLLLSGDEWLVTSFEVATELLSE